MSKCVLCKVMVRGLVIYSTPCSTVRIEFNLIPACLICMHYIRMLKGDKSLPEFFVHSSLDIKCFVYLESLLEIVTTKNL